jgi:hypothetical protein
VAEENAKPTARAGTRGTSTPADIAAQQGSTQGTPQGLTPAQLVQAETQSTPEMMRARETVAREEDTRLGLNVPQPLPAAAELVDTIWYDLDTGVGTIEREFTPSQAEFIQEMGTYYSISVRAALARVETEIAHPMTLNPDTEQLERKRKALRLTMARIESIQAIMVDAG